MLPDLSRYRKFVTAVVGIALIVVANFLPDYSPLVQSVIGILTAIGVYEVPNEA